MAPAVWIVAVLLGFGCSAEQDDARDRATGSTPPPSARPTSAAATSSPTGSTTATTGATDPPGRTSDDPTAPASDDGNDGIATRVIAWVIDVAPLSGGADSLDDTVVQSLADGSCAGPGEPLDVFDEPRRSLYDAALSACRAALQGRTRLWERAESKLALPTASRDTLDCRQRAVLRFTETLLEAHRAAPGARIVRDGSGSGAYGTCPRITEVRPDHGPADGGYPVEVLGEHLPDPVRVHVAMFPPDGAAAVETVLTVRTDGDRGVVPMPAAIPSLGPDRSASIWAEGWPHGSFGATLFRFDDPAGGLTTTAEDP